MREKEFRGNFQNGNETETLQNPTQEFGTIQSSKIQQQIVESDSEESSYTEESFESLPSDDASVDDNGTREQISFINHRASNLSLTQSMIFPSRQGSFFAPPRDTAITEEIRRTTIRNLMQKNHPCGDMIEVLTKDGEGLKSGFYNIVLFKIIRRLSAFIRQTADLK